MKICLFGGTFDPPHIGHLLIAQTVCEAEDFDKILFIPAFTPPHKKSITPVDHRIEMVKTAINDNPKFEYSDVDILRGGVSYTIDSILDVKRKMKSNNDNIYYLIGSDSLIDFKNWKEPKKIFIEVSGGVTLKNISKFNLKGVNGISVGALTHQSTNVDIGLDLHS